MGQVEERKQRAVRTDERARDGAILGQPSGTKPKFEIADVHVSPKSTQQFMRPPQTRGGRYEIKNATRLDLIVQAYVRTPEKILGGPNWLELDRFDVVAKLNNRSGLNR